nr:uncharacterized protein LOC113827230 [Penaeus vannamei]
MAREQDLPRAWAAGSSTYLGHGRPGAAPTRHGRAGSRTYLGRAAGTQLPRHGRPEAARYLGQNGGREQDLLGHGGAWRPEQEPYLGAGRERPGGRAGAGTAPTVGHGGPGEQDLPRAWAMGSPGGSSSLPRAWAAGSKHLP